MNIAGINFESFCDGEGCRCVIFVSGCKHGCKGCHNKETWDFNYGTPISDDIIKRINEEVAKRPFVKGYTISGGDPVYSWDDVVENLINKLDMKNKTLWIYTGFTMDELERMNVLEKMNMVDVIVDGPYIEELRDVTLPFIGSSNQKINRMR